MTPEEIIATPGKILVVAPIYRHAPNNVARLTAQHGVDPERVIYHNAVPAGMAYVMDPEQMAKFPEGWRPS